MERDLFLGAEPRVFVTVPDEPAEGRVFVWSKGRWYEREEGDSGAVEFPHIANSEADLHQWVFQQEKTDLTELDDDFAYMVREEFMDQTPLYPKAPELSEQRA